MNFFVSWLWVQWAVLCLRPSMRACWAGGFLRRAAAPPTPVAGRFPRKLSDSCLLFLLLLHPAHSFNFFPYRSPWPPACSTVTSQERVLARKSNAAHRRLGARPSLSSSFLYRIRVYTCISRGMLFFFSSVFFHGMMRYQESRTSLLCLCSLKQWGTF